MKNKHTQEPWRYSKEHHQVTTSKVGVVEGSKQICQVASFCKTDEEIEANGILLAAAPKLLEKSQFVIDAWEDYIQTGHKGTVQMFIDSLKIEIKKARGE